MFISECCDNVVNTLSKSLLVFLICNEWFTHVWLYSIWDLFQKSLDWSGFLIYRAIVLFKLNFRLSVNPYKIGLCSLFCLRCFFCVNLVIWKRKRCLIIAFYYFIRCPGGHIFCGIARGKYVLFMLSKYLLIIIHSVFLHYFLTRNANSLTSSMTLQKCRINSGHNVQYSYTTGSIATRWDRPTQWHWDYECQLLCMSQSKTLVTGKDLSTVPTQQISPVSPRRIFTDFPRFGPEAGCRWGYGKHWEEYYN